MCVNDDIIAFLALNRDLKSFMELGALFQALVESLMNVQVAFDVKANFQIKDRY